MSRICTDKWSKNDSTEELKGSSQKLCLTQTERLVRMVVGHHRNDQVLRPQAAFGLQQLPPPHTGHLLLVRPALLKDLDDHDAVRALKTEAGVLSNDVSLAVLSDDLVAITRRSVKDIKHDVLNGVSQSAEPSAVRPF